MLSFDNFSLLTISLFCILFSSSKHKGAAETFLSTNIMKVNIKKVRYFFFFNTINKFNYFVFLIFILLFPSN